MNNNTYNYIDYKRTNSYDYIVYLKYNCVAIDVFFFFFFKVHLQIIIDVYRLQATHANFTVLLQYSAKFNIHTAKEMNNKINKITFSQTRLCADRVEFAWFWF